MKDFGSILKFLKKIKDQFAVFKNLKDQFIKII
jgi:hypothetical protein